MLDSTSVETTNYAGAAWDAFGGAADIVVRIYIASETASPIMVDGPDDVHTINYSGAPSATNVRASDLITYLDFRVYDEDVSDYEFIGWCSTTVSAAAFTGTTQTVSCPVDAGTGNSGYTIRWHLEPF